MLGSTKVKTVGEGEPTLIVWRVPDEFTGVKDRQSFAVPILAREGGFLFAVPSSLLDDTVLLDAALEEQGLLGPSNQFHSELIEEDDDGQPTQVGASVTFTVVDVSADVLKTCREYDPVTDASETITPFDEDLPGALPTVTDVLDDIKAWIENAASGRMTFLSAREEPEPPKATPKKASSRKVTTAVLSEQLGLLMNQVKVLAEQQEEMKRQQLPTSVTPAVGGDPGSDPCWNAKRFCRDGGSTFGSCEESHGTLGASSQDQATFGGRERFRDKACGGDHEERGGKWPAGMGKHPHTTRCCPHCPCCPSSQRRCSHRPAGKQQQLRVVSEYKRRCTARASTRRSCEPIQSVFPAGTTAITQTVAPVTIGPKDGGGGAGDRCMPHYISGEAWQFQRPEGASPAVLDSCTQFRRRSCRRLSCNQRVPCSSSGEPRSSLSRRALAGSLLVEPVGRTTSPDVRRESPVDGHQAICKFGTASMGCNSSVVHERSRSLEYQEKRIQEGCHQDGSRYYIPKSSQKASVSQKGQGWGRGPSSKLMKGLGAAGPDEDGHSSLRFPRREGRAPCPGDLWCAEPDRRGKSGEDDRISSREKDKSRTKEEEREKRTNACPQKAVSAPKASHSENPQFSSLETEYEG